MKSNLRVDSLRRLAAILLLSLGLASAASAQSGKLSVSAEMELDVPAEAAWALVGNFKGLERWHPAVAKSTNDGNGRVSGDTRVLTLADGGMIKEALRDYDEDAMVYEYAITASPLPVSDYVSRIAVEPAGEGRSRVTWSSTFNARGSDDAGARKVVTGIYQGGLDQLAQFYNGSK